MDDHLDRLHRLLVEVLGWRHQSGVSRVNAGILHMLRYRDGHHHPVAGYGIYIDLLKREIIIFQSFSAAGTFKDSFPNLGLLYEFRDDDRVFFGHGYSAAQVLFQVTVTVGNVHGCTTENVGGPDQAWITHSFTKLHGRLQRGQTRCRNLLDSLVLIAENKDADFSVGELLPLWLTDPDGVQHAGELKPVLSTVYELWRGSQDAALLAVQRHGYVVGQLASHREDYSIWILPLIDIHHHLSTETSSKICPSLTMVLFSVTLTRCKVLPQRRFHQSRGGHTCRSLY